MTAWTTPEQVIGSWIGEGAPDDTALVGVWIGMAEREIRFRVPDLHARIAAEASEDPPRTDLLDAARDVAIAMVTRIFRNPEGIRQRNTTTGPFTESATYGGDTPGGLDMTESEIAKLQGERGGAFMIDLAPSRAPEWLGWLP